MKDFGTAVILCGGKSSRMGFDKCRIKVNDKFLIDIMGEKLEEVFDEIILLSNDSLKFENSKYRVVKDIIPDSGPLGAIYSALKYASSRYVFITACDMPVINIDFIKYMIEIIKEEKVEGVVSYKSNFVEPLYSFYSVDMIDRFENQLNSNNYKLLGVINSSKMHYIEECEVSRYCRETDVFTNLNYKADLTVLKKIFMGEKIENE